MNCTIIKCRPPHHKRYFHVDLSRLLPGELSHHGRDSEQALLWLPDHHHSHQQQREAALQDDVIGSADWAAAAEWEPGGRGGTQPGCALLLLRYSWWCATQRNHLGCEHWEIIHVEENTGTNPTYSSLSTYVSSLPTEDKIFNRHLMYVSEWVNKLFCSLTHPFVCNHRFYRCGSASSMILVRSSRETSTLHSIHTLPSKIVDCTRTLPLTEYTECQAFYPVVRIGTPPLPLCPRGETYSLAGDGVGDPIPTMGQTLWYTLGLL